MLRTVKTWLNVLRRRGAFRAIAVSAVVGIITTSVPLLALISYDVGCLLRPQSPQDDVILVYANNDTLKELGSDRGYLNRTNHARLLDRLTAEGAALVFYDFDFHETNQIRSDDLALEDAVRRSGRVVLFAPVETIWEQKFLKHNVLAPFKSLRHVAGTNGWGHAELIGNTVRQISGTMEEVNYAPWVGVARLKAGAWEGENPDRVRWLNFYGPPNSDVLPFCHFHNAVLTNGVPPGFFQNKIVFIGQNYSTDKLGSRKDAFPTAFSTLDIYGMMPGVAIHATAFLNLLNGDWLRLLPWGAHGGIVIVWGAVVATLLYQVSRKPLHHSVLIAIGVGTLLVGISLYVQWHHHIWWSWFGPALLQPFATIAWVRGQPKAVEKYLAFISYRDDEDALAAREIYRRLTELGYKVFLDKEKLRVGLFAKQLFQAVEDAKFFIPVVSPNSLRRCVDKNDWVLNELKAAQKLNKQIIPIFRGKAPSDLKGSVPDLEEIRKLLELLDYQSLIFQDQYLDDEYFKTFIKRLLKLLAGANTQAKEAN